MGPAFDDSLRRTQSHRILKSQPAEAVPPRFPERASAADANVFPAPPTMATRAPEPAAFLTMDFEVAKASSTFCDAVGRPSVLGQKLADLLAPSDRDKAAACQRAMQEEQWRSHPSYLPRIVGKEDEARVMRSLGFSADELARYPLDRHEHLLFVGQDGQSRALTGRMGLAKQDSVWFVVVALSPSSMRVFEQPTPSPNPREITYSYQPVQPSFSQPRPILSTFDARPGRLSDPVFAHRPGASAPGVHTPPMVSGLGSGLVSSYTSSPNRADHLLGGQSSYQIPRSELAVPPSPGYQLPPIRSPLSQSQSQTTTQQVQRDPLPREAGRDDRSRVDISGLIDQPETRSRPRPQQ